MKFDLATQNMNTDQLSDVYGDWLDANGFDDSLPLEDLRYCHGQEMNKAQIAWLDAFESAYKVAEEREARK